MWRVPLLWVLVIVLTGVGLCTQASIEPDRDLPLTQTQENLGSSPFIKALNMEVDVNVHPLPHYFPDFKLWWEYQLEEFTSSRIALTVQAQDQLTTPLRQAIVQLAHFDSSTRFIKAGTGVVVHSNGLILTASHVIRKTDINCFDVPSEPLARWVVVLISEKEDQSPVPRYAVSLEDQDQDLDLIEALKKDMALLRITHRLPDREGAPKTLQDLIDPKNHTLINFDPIKITAEEYRALSLSTLIPWDSQMVKPHPVASEPPSPPGTVEQVTVLGYPQLREGGENPVLLPTDGVVADVDRANGLFFVTGERFFATYGDSGGAMIDTKQPLLLGLLCGSKPSLAGEGVLAISRMINDAAPLFEEAEQRFGLMINRAPVPQLNFTPESPEPGQTVEFDASPSWDPNSDRTIVEYRWVFVDDEQEFSLPPQTDPRVSFTFHGERAKVKLTVRDDQGAETFLEHTLTLKLDLPGCLTRVEGQPKVYARIQDAVQAAPEGAIITVEGECQQNVTVDKRNLHLRGVNQPRLVGDGQQPVIKITAGADGVLVEGFLLEKGSVGVLVNRVARVTLRDNEIRDQRGPGVQVISSVEVQLVNNWLEVNDQAGLEIFQAKGFPLSARVSLEENIIRANQNKGLFVCDGSQVTLARDVLEGNVGIGILIRGGAQLELTGVEVQGTTREAMGEFGHGIAVEEGSTVTIAGGHIKNNENTGLLVTDSITKVQKTSIISNGSNGIRAVGIATRTEVGIWDAIVENNLVSGIASFNYTATFVSNSSIQNNGFRGVYVKGPEQAKLIVQESIITRNHLDEIVVAGSATATIRSSTISRDQTASGIFVADYAQVEIMGNKIEGNAGCGIAASRKALVTGGENEISGNNPDICCPVSAALKKTPPPIGSVVRVPEDVATIQEAVDILQPGGMIIVGAGDYAGAVTITKDLTLQGAGVDKTSIRNVIQALPEARKVIIEGMTVTTGRDGIRLCEATEADIKRVRIADSGTGLLVPAVTRATLNEVIVERNERGIVVTDEGEAIIDNSVISGNRLRVRPSPTFPSAPSDLAGAVVPASTTRQSQEGKEAFKPGYFAGIVTTDSAQVVVRSSKVIYNENGVVVTDIAGTIVVDSEISGSDFIGVQILDRASFEIRGTVFARNKFGGIQVNGSGGGTIAMSQIKENGEGIWVFSSDSGIILLGNEISDNVGRGIWIRESSQVEVAKSEVRGTQQVFTGNLGIGISIEASDGIIIRNSQISRNEGDGILISSSEVNLNYNTIQENGGCGIRADEASVVFGTGNEISGNTQGDICGNIPEGVCRAVER